MDELMRAHRWVSGSAEWHGTRQKKIYLKYFKDKLSPPTFNGYLASNGVPWPLPPLDHLVYLVDGETAQIRWVSPSLSEALRRPPETLLEQNVGVLHPQPPPTGLTELWQTVKNREQVMVEHDAVLLHADGLWLPVHARVTYGQDSRYSPRNEIFFVDATIAGEPFAPSPQDLLFDPKVAGADDESIFNVDPRLIIELRKPESKADALEMVRHWKDGRPIQMSAIQINSYRALLERFGIEQHHGDTNTHG